MDGLAVPDEKGSVFSLRTQELLAPLFGDETVVEEQIHVLHHITPVSVTSTSTGTATTILFR